MNLFRKVNEQGLFIEDVILDSIPILTESVTETIYTPEVVGVEYRDELQTIVLEDGSTQEVSVSVPYEVIENVPHTITKEVPVTTEEIYYEEVTLYREETIVEDVPIYESVPVYAEDGITVLYEEQVPTGETTQITNVIEVPYTQQVEKTRLVNVLNPYYIDMPVTEGFYHPKWDFEDSKWIEGMSQEEIDILKNVTPVQTTEERLEELATKLYEQQIQLEMSQEALDFVIMGGM